MLIEKTFNGLHISDIVGDHYIKKLYIGYSKRESIKLFKKYKKEFTNESLESLSTFNLQ